jgi:hypothetical protein
MLLIAIPIAWLTVIALVVAACQSASKGDASLFTAAAGEDGHASAPMAYRAERRTGGVSRELHLPAELTPSH